MNGPRRSPDDFAERCPKCGAPALGDSSGPVGALCVSCGFVFGEFGEDASDQVEAVMDGVRRSHDRFERDLFDQLKSHLDDPDSETSVRSDVRNLLERIAPQRRADEPDPLIDMLALELVDRTRKHHRLRRLPPDPSSEADPDSDWSEEPPNPLDQIFDKTLAPAFVLDFLEECRRFLDEIPAADRPLLEQRLGVTARDSTWSPLAAAQADLLLIQMVGKNRRRNR